MGKPVVAEYLRPLLGREPESSEVATWSATYAEEWNTGITYLPTVPTLVKELSDRFRPAVVSNTYEPDLVPAHRAAPDDRYADVVPAEQRLRTIDELAGRLAPSVGPA